MAAIAIPQFSAYKDRAYNSDSQAALHNLFLACKAYWADNGSNSTCTEAQVTTTAYGITANANIPITGAGGTETSFTATAINSAGGNAAGYSIDETGTITAN